MLAIYLFGLFVILSTEYGFQSRSRAISRWAGGWRWSRTAVRTSLMAILGLAMWRLRVDGPLLYAAAGTLWAELGAWLQRRWIRADLARGQKHGALLTHFFPLVYPLALMALLWGVSSLTQVPSLPRPSPRFTLVLAAADGLVALWAWATLVVVSIVSIVRPEQVKDTISPRVGAGEIIGILERYVTLALVLVGGLAAVGFVVAAKAAARFPQFKREEFAEYFLIGTLSSVGMAVLSGLALRAAYRLLI